MKKILIIYSAFAPQNNCAAIPNTKLVKYLSRCPLDITLLTNAVTPAMDTDESLLSEEIRKLRRFSVPNSKLYLATVGAGRDKITGSGVKLKMKAEVRPFRAKLVQLLSSLYFRFKRFDWVTGVKRTVTRNFKKGEFDLVFSSYPEAETHETAQFVLRKGYAKKWIADFRDPMNYAMFAGDSFSKDQLRQFSYERQADRVIVNSEGALEKFKGPGVDENKIFYLPNGFDPEDFSGSAGKGNTPSDRLRFFYAGTLYAGKRDLSVLFSSISQLQAQGRMEKNAVCFEYAGAEWPIFLGFAQKYGLEDCCVNYGYVTHRRVMELLGEVDCSVVCTHNTAADKGVVTGKVFELLLAEKPIIAVVGGDLPDSELGAIIKDCNAGVVYEQANGEKDRELLREWLYVAYKEKSDLGSVTSHLNPAQRDKYSYENIARRLYDIIQEA